MDALAQETLSRSNMRFKKFEILSQMNSEVLRPRNKLGLACWLCPTSLSPPIFPNRKLQLPYHLRWQKDISPGAGDAKNDVIVTREGFEPSQEDSYENAARLMSGKTVVVNQSLESHAITTRPPCLFGI